MAVGDLYRIILQQNYVVTTEVNNVFYYEMTAADSPDFGAAAIAAAFDFSILPLLAATQTTNITYFGITAENLDDPADFAFRPSSSLQRSEGDIFGDAAPPFVSLGFIYVRPTRAIRNGYKRIAGCPAIETANGAVTAGTFKDAADDLADGFGNLITNIPESVAAEPRIARISSGSATLVVAPTAVQLVGWGTQNSRKFGRGS